MNYDSIIFDYIHRETEVLNALSVNDIDTVIDVLEKARLGRKRILTCGNGGSAATASHMVRDLENGASRNKDPKFDAECLSDNTPAMMAAI